VTYTYTPENHPCTVYLATRLWHDVFGKRREWDEKTVGEEVGRLGEYVSALSSERQNNSRSSTEHLTWRGLHTAQAVGHR